MPSGDLRPPVILIVGPTGVGKSGIALQLAGQLNGEIISADSRLVYRGMDIGTDKPTPADRASVPHHLIDIADPDEAWTLADFQEAALSAVEEIYARGNTAFLVGGTGQYVRAFTEGWRIPRQEPDPALRRRLERQAEEEGLESLYRRLEALDPRAAQTIEPRNARRIIRALEVIQKTGTRFSEQRSRSEPQLRPLVIGLLRPRAELYVRIDARIDGMIRSGLVEEVRRLLELGYSPDLPSFSAIGYREIADFLEGKISLEGAKKAMKKRSRQLVRRQANWFKPDDPAISWFQAGQATSPEAADAIRSFLREVPHEAPSWRD